MSKIRAALEAAKESLKKISEAIEGSDTCHINAVLPSDMDDAGFPETFTLIGEAIAELEQSDANVGQLGKYAPPETMLTPHMPKYDPTSPRSDEIVISKEDTK